MKNSVLLLLFVLSNQAFAQWQTNGSSLYYNNGNVGIGTITPQSKLEVNGVIQSSNAGFNVGGSTTGMGSDGFSLYLKAGGNTYLNTSSNAYVTNSGGGYFGGYLGVGTLVASQRLDVTGRLKFRSDNNTTAGAWFTGNDGVETVFLGQTSTSGNSSMGIWHGGAWRFLVDQNGNVGIGVTTPSQKLEVNGIIQSSNNGIKIGPAYTAIASDGLSLYLQAGGNTYLNTSGNAYITNYGGAYFSNNVGIGTTTPDAKLAVKGTIHTQEVKVDLDGAMVPDYVFEKDYSLPSLEEVKSYIDANKHLPEVPSAKEIEANGVNLGEMNLLLLKKIEELTLYVIELKKEINQLKQIQK